MKEKFLDRLTSATNRSKGQTLFLLGLVDNDLFKLLELEEKLANNFVNYCPGDKEECERVLAMTNGDEKFKLDFSWNLKEKEVKPVEIKVTVKTLPQKSKNEAVRTKNVKPVVVKSSTRKVITEADLRNVAQSIIGK